jgi:phosphoglycolate phosphatase-like HAD superfamily hydrolase
VGDDPALEMRMANAAGAMSIGLATGIMGSEADLPARDRPSVLLNDLQVLLEAL